MDRFDKNVLKLSVDPNYQNNLKTFEQRFPIYAWKFKIFILFYKV